MCYNISICAITETWVEDKSSALQAACPAGYSIKICPRKNRQGGGTGLLYRSDLILLYDHELSSCQCSHWEVIVASQRLQVMVFYRPPSSSVSDFCCDFMSVKENSCTNPLILLRDFKFHMNIISDRNASLLRDSYCSLGLQNLVKLCYSQIRIDSESSTGLRGLSTMHSICEQGRVDFFPVYIHYTTSAS